MCTSQRSWVYVILKNRNWTSNFRNYEGRVVLRVLYVVTLENCALFAKKGSCITCDGSMSLRHYSRTAQRIGTSERRCGCVHAKKKEDSLEQHPLLEADCRCFGYDKGRSRRRKVEILLKAQLSHKDTIFSVIHHHQYGRMSR